MFNHKKTAAFIVSLILCASAAAPVFSVYSHEGHDHNHSAETTEVTEAAEEATEEATAEVTDDSIVSGDFKYVLTSDGNACITGYTGSDTELVIPEELDGIPVTEIGQYSFMGTDFETVRIHADIEYILGNPFLDNYKLREIIVDEGNEKYYSADGILYEKNDSGEDCLAAYPQGNPSLSFTVPDNVTEIHSAALYNTQLTEIILPSSIKSIETHGISYNERITSIDLSHTQINGIADMVFAYCTGLKNVVFPENLISIGGASFAGCTSLEEIELPETLLYIDQNAFAATGLKTVTIPASVTEIGYCAFGYDENLEPIDSFTIVGVTGSIAQSYCTDSDEEYGYANNFSFVDVENADLVAEAAGLENIEFGEYTYAEKDGEAYITACVSVGPTIEVPAEINGLPVTRIYGGAFFQNQAEKIILPDSVKKIDSLAFYMCSQLKSIDMPASLEIMDNQAFADCTALESVEIPSTCTTIGEEVFLGCTAIKEYTVTGEGGAYCSENGVLYNGDKTVIVAYPAANEAKSYKAPSTVKEILLSAFYSANNLESVDISSVVTIGNYAFESCASLNSVKLSEDLEKIGTLAFYDCLSLKSLRTYNNITEIGTAAIGYYYDENDTENGGDVLIEGFKLYADEDSGGARYALMNGIVCESDTVDVMGANVEKPFIYVILGAVAAAILAVVGIITGKSLKKKKEEKKLEKIKAEAQKKLEEREKNQAEQEDSDEENE